MPNIQVIFEIRKKKFCHTRRRLLAATCAVTVVPHMHFCVSNFKQHWLFCYLITLLIVLLIMNDFVVYQHFILSEFNRSWMFLKQFLPIVITLQVLHIIFKLKDHSFRNACGLLLMCNSVYITYLMTLGCKKLWYI